MSRNRIALLALLVFPVLGGRGAAAQKDPRLASAVRLARDGLGDSARAVVGRILAATPSSDSLYPEVLYTVAVVAADVPTKRLYLQRVAVEHSQSAWADDARLELAQLDYAERDLEGAVRHAGRLLADYPFSPLRAAAALWGARAAIDKGDLPLACQWAYLGVTAAGEEVELRHQLEFQRQRCQTLILAESTAAARPPARDTGRTPTRPAGPQWFVQVAAFRTRDQADRTVALLQRARISATVVLDAGFHKVRAGPYRARDQAQAALPAIRRQVGGQPFVVQVP
jgi:hypothetical protein